MPTTRSAGVVPPQQRRADDNRFDELLRRLEELVDEVREMRRSVEQTYLRQDVYTIAHEALRREVRELRRDADAIVEQQAANRRLAVSGLVLPIVSGLLLALLLAAFLPVGPG